MKGIFQAGPTMDPLFQMYLTTQWFNASVSCTSKRSRLTLIVYDRQTQQRKKDCPPVRGVKDSADNSTIVGRSVARICPRRGKAGVDSHGGGVLCD